MDVEDRTKTLEFTENRGTTRYGSIAIKVTFEAGDMDTVSDIDASIFSSCRGHFSAIGLD